MVRQRRGNEAHEVSQIRGGSGGVQERDEDGNVDERSEHLSEADWKFQRGGFQAVDIGVLRATTDTEAKSMMNRAVEESNPAPCGAGKRVG
jgi:hypothetical protein